MMKRLLLLVALLLGLSLSAFAQAQSKFPQCKGNKVDNWNNCFATLNEAYGDKYVGEFKNGKKDGQGTFTTTVGDKYVGNFKNNEITGYGLFNFADKSKYEGNLINGVFNGFGIFYDAYGNKYAGEFKSGKYYGQGTYTNFLGDVYKGDFVDGKFEGYGVYVYGKDGIDVKNFSDKNNQLINDTFVFGLVYKGYFIKGKKHGKGIATADGGNLHYEGIWENDKFVRAEKVNLPSINHHSGVVINDELGKLDADRQVQSKLPPCPPVNYSRNSNVPHLFQRLAKWSNCWGRYKDELDDKHTSDVLEGEWLKGLLHGLGTYYYLANNQFKGDKYVGEFKYGGKHGQGTYTFANGEKYVGEWKDGKYNGQGIYTFADGRRQEGIWENDKFIREAKVYLPNINNNVATNTDRADIDRERQQLAEERRRLEDERRQREQSKQPSKLSLQITTTNPDINGSVIISVRTNADTSSLKVNGEEQGGRPDGNYVIKKVARVGQDTQFTVVATDVNGNTDSKTATVFRKTVESAAVTASLNPENIKTKSSRDAVAVIIGISNYKSLPRADFAKDDAQVFYDYAIRALGIKPENIKLLLDADAEEVEIFKAFKTWLPARVKSTTDVYVFYSGHGLPTSDGLGLYMLPYRADRDLISKTAIQFQEINMDIQAAKPKSVTIFMDACYSGQARGGETLIASARPLALKVQTTIFPTGFTVFSASQSDQISSSSPDLKHGIFSYYLMKGMEGDADANKDGKITLGEMQGYLAENVGRQAGMMNRKQEPQLIGDANKVLVVR